MQIQLTDTNQAAAAGTRPLAIGQVYTVSIKERLSSSAAVVSLNGREMKMAFEGGVPSEQRILIEITSRQNDTVIAKQVAKNVESAQSGTSLDLDGLLRTAGLEGASLKEVQQAARILLDKGYSMTSELAKMLQQWMKTEAGSVAQKLETIKAAAGRGLEMTDSHLKAIHTALHGESISKVMEEVGKELPLLESRRETSSILRLIAAIESSEDDAFIRKQVLAFIKGAKLDAGEKGALLKSLPEGKTAILHTLHSLGQKGSGEAVLTAEAEMLKSLLKTIQRQPDMEQVLNQVRTFSQDDRVQRMENYTDFSTAVAKAEGLSASGRELSARKVLTEALGQLEERNPELRQPVKEALLTAEELNSISQAVQSLKLDSKNILVTEISQRLAQLTIDFKQTKRDIGKNLDQSLQLLSNRQPQVKQVLESTIKQLDTAILKGDYMLYADMGTEKKLLLASSRLQEARSLLMNGNFGEASQIVREVKASVEGLVFKPSDVKVKHFVAGMEEQQVQVYKPEQPSGRQMLELIRKLGMMNEADTVKALLDGKQPEARANVKSALLHALNDGGLNPKLAAQAEQAVQTITGQQLLAKPDSSGLQQLALHLPLMLQKQVEDVKVFVQANGENETLDWENCSLYFVLETKRLGEIGISLTANNRNLFITFTSDKKDLSQRLEPLAETTFERLGEIGYSIGTVQVKPFKRETEEMEQQARTPIINPFAGKGYDRTI
ncbi:hypothetical protein [Pradoshia sp.]|uniref:hypothetical protein n=1 Tax=Pradoshia sp. TaxID=2651281 RepID=UPI003F0EA340